MKQLDFIFFDGINYYTSQECRNKIFLSSPDYQTCTKAYIEVNNEKNFLWSHGNVKANSKNLSSFKNFTKEELVSIAEKYNLTLNMDKKDKEYIYIYIYGWIGTIIQTVGYDILYNIGGDRSPEYIYIYGVFEK